MVVGDFSPLASVRLYGNHGYYRGYPGDHRSDTGIFLMRQREWKVGDHVRWWQSSEWDSDVPRQGRGIIEKSPFGGLWVRDEDTNDCHELNYFDLEPRI